MLLPNVSCPPCCALTNVKKHHVATGASESYTVPSHSGVTSITLKLWGAGGGGALTPGASLGADNETASSNVTQGTIGH